MQLRAARHERSTALALRSRDGPVVAGSARRYEAGGGRGEALVSIGGSGGLGGADRRHGCDRRDGGLRGVRPNVIKPFLGRGEEGGPSGGQVWAHGFLEEE